MNISNKFCRYTVATICGTCFLVIMSMFGVTDKHVEAVENQIPGAVINKESVQSTINANVNLVLVGTVLSDAGKSVAIFEDNKTNSQQFHRLGDTIEGGRITMILKDRVFLTKDDVEVELKIGYGTGGTFVQDQGQSYDSGGDDQLITTNTLKPLAGDEDLSELENNVTQIYEGGAEVIEVEEDGLLSKLGLRPGDIIRHVNSHMPDLDLSFSEAVAQDIKNGEGQLRLEMERDGEKKIIYNMFVPDPPAE